MEGPGPHSQGDGGICLPVLSHPEQSPPPLACRDLSFLLTVISCHPSCLLLYAMGFILTHSEGAVYLRVQ